MNARQEPEFVSHQVLENRRYYLNLEPSLRVPLTVVCGGRERCREDYLVRRETFPFFALEYVAEGAGKLTLQNREYRLRPGMAFVYGPEIAHSIRTDPQAPMLKYYVDFAGAEAAKLLAESPLAGGATVQVSTPQELTEIFEQLHRSGSSETPFAQKLTAALLPYLLLKITERAIPYSPMASRALASHQRAKRYIEDHFLVLKTIEEAAAACHMDLSYLCRLFQRFDHLSPYQYLLRLKMNRAAELLLDSSMMVKEVAAALDFSDAYNFSRAFKTVFGLSPEKFARQGARLG